MQKSACNGSEVKSMGPRARCPGFVKLIDLEQSNESFSTSVSRNEEKTVPTTHTAGKN